MKTLISLLLICTVFVQVSGQNLWLVSNNPGFLVADFDNIQEAIDSAEHGDIIYVQGTGLNYGTCTLDKKLHLIGAGYWKSENAIPGQTTDPTRILGSLHFAAGSDSSIVEGFNITSYIEIATDNIILRYNSLCCDFAGWQGIAGYIVFTGSPVNSIVYGNAILATMKGPAISASVFNNIFLGADDEGGWANNDGSVDCIVQNNAYAYNGCCEFNIANCTFRNNIVLKNQAAFTNCTVENNIFADDDVSINGAPVDSLGNGNIDSVDMTMVWDLSNPSPDGEFQLIGTPMTNPAFGAGIGGEDCGPYGGATPYKLSGIVPIPSIYQMLVPLTGDTTNMLNIRIKAKTN